MPAHARHEPRRRAQAHGALWGLWLWFAACGGQTITPLDPRDPALPLETRRLVSDVEDGIVVARAQVAAAERRLQNLEGVRDEVLDSPHWETGGQGLRAGLEELFEARVELAEQEVALADAGLQLSQVKYRLVTAERAMLHDLGRYELGPLQAEVAQVRSTLDERLAELQRQRGRLSSTTRAFWRGYGDLVANTRSATRPFWLQ